jgi:MFS family permease
MATIPLLYLVDMLPLPALIGLIAIVGAADGPANAAKSVFIPEVTRAARVPLERGTGLASALERLASTLGPAIGGFVVAAVGGVYALWVTAGLIAVGAVIVAAVVPRPRPARDGAMPDGYLSQLREGAAFLRRDRLLRSIAGMVAVTNLLDAAMVSVALPVWAYDSGHGPVVIGLLASVMSGFSIIASLVAAMLGPRLPRRTVYLVGFLIAGAPRFVVVALGAPMWLIVAVHATAGFASGFLNPILGAVQFERIPAQLLGRVKTLTLAVAWCGIPFGGLAGGALIALVGLSPALLVLGAAYLITTTLPGLQKEWAQMNRSAPPTEPAQARSTGATG